MDKQELKKRLEYLEDKINSYSARGKSIKIVNIRVQKKRFVYDLKIKDEKESKTIKNCEAGLHIMNIAIEEKV